MRLINSDYGLNIELKENKTEVLIIENATYMRHIIQELHNQSLGEEGEFLIVENEESVSASKKMAIIIDFFSLDFNDKKIMNKVYAELAEQSLVLHEQKEKINSEIVALLDQIIEQSQYSNMNYNLDIDWNQLMKLYNVKIDMETPDLLEKLIEYMKILTSILHLQILVLVNLKSYLEENEILKLYEMAGYLKVYLLLIEPSEKDKIGLEVLTIIDKDRCVIVK